MTKNLISAFSAATGAGDVQEKYPVKLYRRKDVCAMLGFPSSTLTDYINKGIFPKPLKLNPQESNKHGSAAWLESDILEFVATRPRAE